MRPHKHCELVRTVQRVWKGNQRRCHSQDYMSGKERNFENNDTDGDGVIK